jgi:hypothetical protein
MSWVTGKNRHVLCSGDTEIVYANIRAGRKGIPQVTTFARLSRELNKPFNAASLAAGTGRKKLQLALVLPLREFSIVSVTVPPVDREAVAKMLPYSLAKALDQPVTDFIYDWQVAQRFKDRQELTVYLFPSTTFEDYRRELQARGREITWFEPDVFSASSFLEAGGFVAAQTTVLSVLAWGTSVSIVVFGENRVSLVRTVDLIQPPGRPGEIESVSGQSGTAGMEAENSGDRMLAEATLVEATRAGNGRGENIAVSGSGERGAPGLEVEDSSFSDLLAGFGLQDGSEPERRLVREDEEQREGTLEETSQPPATLHVDRWQEYIDALNLEIMRTVDYHSSVLKGAPIQEIFLGGCESFFEELSAIINTGHAITVHHFPPVEIEADCGQLLAALCIGATQR